MPCEYDEKAYALLEASYAERQMEFTDARKRMARMPRGAEHMARRMESNADTVYFQPFAKPCRLRSPCEIAAIAQAHDVERLSRGQH